MGIALPFKSAPCFDLVVLQARVSALAWLPAILWMAVIFSGSTDVLSTERTSRIIGPLLRWLKPDLSEHALKNAQFAIRKGAHVTEYAVFAVLLWRALRGSVLLAPWNWRQAQIALGLAVLYAITDEIHQALVQSRMGSTWDVLIDACGAALGLFLVWRFGRFRKSW